MLMEVSGGGTVAAPPPPPPKPPPPPIPPAAHTRPPGDTIAPSTQHPGPSLFGRAENWTEDWGSLAGFGHGLASVPGVVSREWSKASELNAKLASKTEHLATDWGKTAASARSTAIADIDKTAHGASTAAKRAVSTMQDANRVPLFLERNADRIAGVDRTVTRVAGVAKAAVSDSIDRAPRLLRAPLHWVAGKAEGALARKYDSVKGAAKQVAADSNYLSHEAESSLHSVAGDLKTVSESQGARAGGFIAKTSRQIGTTLGERSNVLNKVPGLRDVPILGAALTVGTTIADARDHGWGDSIVANTVQTGLATYGSGLAANGLTAVAAGAGLADGEATLLGAAAATGPAGWAVAGGVALGVGAGYLAYKAIESKEGQHIIAGAEHDVAAAATGAVHIGKSIGHDIGHAFSSIF